MAREREGALRVAGPLGLWPFPILNLVLELFETVRAGRGGFAEAGSATSLANVEVWEWVDRRGKKRTLTVRREVHR